MTLQVTGKNVDAGEAYQSYIEGKIQEILEKYIGREIDGHIRLEKERSQFRTNCSIRMPTGMMLEAHGDGGDAYASADAALEKLEKRVRRHKRRLKNHHSKRSDAARKIDFAARDYTVQMADQDGADEADDNPIVVAETERNIREIPVSDAVLQLDLSDNEFLIFRNAAHGKLNVVYRRQDGHIGWIDPEAVDGTSAIINGSVDSQ
jgi:ribosome hibernation promoting factor